MNGALYERLARTILSFVQCLTISLYAQRLNMNIWKLEGGGRLHVTFSLGFVVCI